MTEYFVLSFNFRRVKVVKLGIIGIQMYAACTYNWYQIMYIIIHSYHSRNNGNINFLHNNMIPTLSSIPVLTPTSHETSVRSMFVILGWYTNGCGIFSHFYRRFKVEKGDIKIESTWVIVSMNYDVFHVNLLVRNWFYGSVDVPFTYSHFPSKNVTNIIKKKLQFVFFSMLTIIL